MSADDLHRRVRRNDRWFGAVATIGLLGCFVAAVAIVLEGVT